jgi:hypothetical protein
MKLLIIVPAQVTDFDDKMSGDKIQEWNTIEKSDFEQDDNNIFHPDDEIILDPKESLEAPIKRVLSHFARTDDRQVSERVHQPKNGPSPNLSQNPSHPSNKDYLAFNLSHFPQIPTPHNPKTTDSLTKIPSAKLPLTRNPHILVERHLTPSAPMPQSSNTLHTIQHPFQKSPIVFHSWNRPRKCSIVNPHGH